MLARLKSCLEADSEKGSCLQPVAGPGPGHLAGHGTHQRSVGLLSRAGHVAGLRPLAAGVDCRLHLKPPAVGYSSVVV